MYNDTCVKCVYQSDSHFSIAALVWHKYLVLFYEPRKDLEALSYRNKIDKTGYTSCRHYESSHISTQEMLPIKSIKVMKNR